jgi:integrase
VLGLVWGDLDGDAVTITYQLGKKGQRVYLKSARSRRTIEIPPGDGVVVQPAPTFHDLRHTHASALLAAGVDIEQVSARLGHASVAVTMTVHIHEYIGSRTDRA